MFDIKDFYPSIKEKLLWETIRFAKRYISIASKDIDKIFHTRKSLSYYNDEPWVKKGESNYDVTIGSNDRAEVYELIGIFMLPLLSKHINKNYIGLYRDYGLAILKNTILKNPTKKPTIFTSIQTTLHQPLKKFHNHFKKDSQLCDHQEIVFTSQPFIMKNA